MKMEKFILRKCVNPLRFIMLASFILCSLLLLFDYSVLNDTKNIEDTFLVSSSSPIPFLHLSIDRKPTEEVKILSLTNSSVSSPVKRASRHVISWEKKKTQPPLEEPKKKSETNDSCSGRYIYVHNLPKKFNEDLIENCRLPHLKWSEVCRFIWENMGLGPKVESPKRVLMNKGWFFTNQFSLEVIFHHRMKQYKCLTKDSALAAAIYVPFYAGLDVGPYLWGFNISVRDRTSIDFAKWVSGRSEWKRMWGRDHFLVGGRITWDFRRNNENDLDWGNKLMMLPESNNMTMLTIEKGYWSNEFAIPYPTYFHPSNEKQIFEWQKKMKRQKRPFLFSFIGGPRPNQEDSIRGELINQCKSSRDCNFLACLPAEKKCGNPVTVMKTFQSSVFCLQPPGDSLTRRSIFDSILAGCIPVFFHPGTAYEQYVWHFPKNYKKYSVFIPMKKVKGRMVNISDILLAVSSSEISGMRNEVIRMIPRMIYADPRSKLETLEDAFDISINAILERVEGVRKGIREGKDPSVGFADMNFTKFDFP